MFDSYASTSNSNNTNIKINACSGGIYKTYKESWFERFSLSSNRAEILLTERLSDETIEIEESKLKLEHIKVKEHPTRNYYGDNRERINYYQVWGTKKTIVLQMVINGDNTVLAELIDQKDLSKYFEVKETE